MLPMHPERDDDRTTLLDNSDAGHVVEDGIGPGHHIGPYRLVALLGEGGMGQVFLAEQVQPIRRNVALKLIQRQLAGSLADAYFEVERQALARMDHPAIAKVFDAGRTKQGYPYFAMEFVEGRSLDRWRQEDAPDERARIRAIIALAYGVQHAHQRGIVHRDVKPTNIIMAEIDGRPQPKLIDFGIAVGVDAEPVGEAGNAYERAGSGPYMSPEQFSHDNGIDTRADVYSMGMVLLSLLLPLPGLRALGDPPPQREVLHERLTSSLEQREHDDPVLDAIPFELRCIIATAIHPQREQRYASAMALAQDLQRYLDTYPVEAVPASARYRLRKFIKRRRRPLIMASAAMFALVVGLAVAIWGLIEAGKQARRSQATSDFLSTVLAGVNPDRARDLDKTLLREVLDTAAQRATVELADQPDALADIESVIASSYEGLGEYTDAFKHAKLAYELAGSTYGANDTRTLSFARQYGRAQIDTGALDEAEAFLRTLIVRATDVVGGAAPLTLRLNQTLGWGLRESGKYQAAYAILKRNVERQTETLGPEHLDTLDSEFALAIVLSDLERWDESIDLFKRLIGIWTRTHGAEHTTTLTLRNSLAVAYLQSKRYADGEVELRDMIPLYEKVFGPDSSMTVMLSANMGGALRQQGKVAESGPYYERAAQTNLNKLGPKNPRTIMSRHNYGNYLYDANRFEDAYELQRAELENGRETFGDQHPVNGEILTSLGRAATALGRHAEAETALLASLTMKQELLGTDSTRLKSTRDALIELYEAMGRDQDAMRYRDEPQTLSPTAGAIDTAK